jgi:hypothetical protein
MTVWPAYQHFEEKSKGSVEVGKLADFVILSRDPTQGDPNTIDLIKVTETVKEGKTVFRMSADVERKADAGTGEGLAKANEVFGRALRGMAVARELEAMPAYLKQPAVLRHFASLPHDPSCSTAVIDELMRAMVSGTDPRATAAASDAAVH